MESRSINFYKGIAMLCVIGTHVGAGSLPYGLGRIGANGARGVQLFFLISSYLAFVSFQKNIEKKELNLKSTGEWLFGKYIKIIPLYIISIFVYLLIQGNGGRYWLGSIEKVSLFNILSHIFFLNAFQPYYINSIQGVEWYLADLFIFYLLTPVLFKWINTLKKAVILLVSSNIFSVWLTYFLSGFCPIKDLYIWETYISNFAFFCQFPVWVMGIVVYHLGNKETQKNNKVAASLLVVALLLMLLMMKGMDLRLVSGFFLWGIVFGLVIIGEKKARISFARNVFIEYIGKISYSMYLFHYLIIYLWEKYVNDSEVTMFDFVWKYICIVAILIFGSSVVYSISEKMKSYIKK